MSIEYTCDKCNFSEEIEEAIYKYDLNDEILIISRPCWCQSCNSLSVGEYIPSEQEILNEAKAWEDEDNSHEYKFAMGPIGGVTDKLKYLVTTNLY